MATMKEFIPVMEFHPGLTLHDKLMEMEMGVKEFAVRTSKPEKTIFAVIHGKSSVTSDMAVAFERVTKIPAGLWLGLQRGYDEYMARQREAQKIAESYEWASAFPLRRMAELGWIPKAKSKSDKVAALLDFFQVSSKSAWEVYYLKGQLKVAFRISLSRTKEMHAISAWLRQGEIQLSGMEVGEFSEKALRHRIGDMLDLCARQPDDFATQLQSICAKAGVKLTYTPCLPNAPINGATRWINGIPCIQMTDRQKRNDIFWFSFFHELGHILLHRRKDVFLENVNYSDREDEKEAEADAFASDAILSKAEEEEIISRGDYSVNAIRHFATAFNVHPGIIVGRLQHKGLVPFSFGHELFCSVSLF